MRYGICRRCGLVAAVNSDELCYGCIRLRGSHGRTGRPKTVPVGGNNMKRLSLLLLVVSVSALALASSALAVTVPAIPVDDYGDALLSGLATAVSAVLPYAAAVTAFAIGVGMIRRWLGARKATKV